MLENDFEKRVQKKMEEWKVRPSVSVWPDLERRIREKKRKRRWILIIPMLAGLALGGYFVKQYLLVPNKFQPKDDSEKVIKKQNAQENPVISIHEKNLRKITEPEQKTELTRSALHKKNRLSIDYAQPETGQFDLKSPFLLGKLSELEKDGPLPGIKERVNNITENENPIVAQAKTDKVNHMDRNREIILPANKLLKDSSVSGKKKPENKIKWGFHFSVGISDIANHLLAFSQNKSAGYSTSPNPGTGGNLFSPSTANSNKAGIGLQAGILAQKKFSKHSSISAGLQYDYYSNHIIGYSSDSSIRISYDYSATPTVNRTYQNTTRYEYTNHFHLISLPASYHYYLNQGKKHPLSLNAGFAIGRLISTNAMVFDTASGGIYFRDKNLVRKTQTRLSSGFSLTLNRNNAVQFVIGPQFEFALTSLYQKRFDKTKYLVYGSMNVNVLFPRK
jgi:Outer membrane protein beta-barrel domain